MCACVCVCVDVMLVMRPCTPMKTILVMSLLMFYSIVEGCSNFTVYCFVK